ncbi:hypothetical protein M5D96_004513 [Drosophila gunungcola]|uniref:Uncharacterized protein n=1 Tax=Drosophila gunungcola TaxID=103775 RepID=A0A9P9YU85_9MUSC|nr:hypothetical protein M5D96_004513 [Drosophila gunungcola]
MWCSPLLPAARAPPTPLTRKIYATSCSCGQQPISSAFVSRLVAKNASEKPISSAPGSWAGVHYPLSRIESQPALDDSGCDAAAAATTAAT